MSSLLLPSTPINSSASAPYQSSAHQYSSASASTSNASAQRCNSSASAYQRSSPAANDAHQYLIYSSSIPLPIPEATVCNKTICDEKTMLMCYCIRDNGERRGNSYPLPQSGNCKEPIQNCSVCYKVGIVFGCPAGAQFCYTDAILDAGPPPKLRSICPLSTFHNKFNDVSEDLRTLNMNNSSSNYAIH